MFTFECGMNTDKKTIISVRPGKLFPGLIEELEKGALENGRSLNNFVCNILNNHIKNEQAPNLSIKRETDSKAS